MSTPISHSAAAQLYTRVAETDPERYSGNTVHYASFRDFLQTVKDEANDPTKVGAADILDIINPLQHLPIIGTVYRRVTGDTMKPGSDIIGGTVFGGGIGLAASSVNVAVHERTGADMEENVLAALSPREARIPPTVQVAMAQDTSAPAAAQIIWDTPAPTPTLASSAFDPPADLAPTTVADAVIAMNTGTFALEQDSAAPNPGGVAMTLDLARVDTTLPTPPRKPAAPAYMQMVMTDPERTAGTIAIYA